MGKEKEKVEWRTIKGFETYEVSNTGRIRRSNGREVKPSIDVYGYLRVDLYDGKKRKTKKVHRLVVEAFMGVVGKHVNHKNEIKTDNRIENLESCSVKYNIRYSQAKQVLQIKDGEVVRLWDSIHQACEDGYFQRINISRCCRGLYGIKQHKGYIWKFLEDVMI